MNHTYLHENFESNSKYLLFLNLYKRDKHISLHLPSDLSHLSKRKSGLIKKKEDMG
jgi:hypothetical protein